MARMLDALSESVGADRAAVFLEEPGAADWVRLASVGHVTNDRMMPGAPPDSGPWSAEVPIVIDGRALGVILLGRTRGGALAGGALDRAHALAELLARDAQHDRHRTELLAAQAQLARSDRLSGLGTLAAGVAHEIRNPLVSVRTFLQLLPERYEDPQFRGEFRELALSEVERICELISDLLGFSKPVGLETGQVDLNSIAEQTTRLLEPQARNRGVRMRLDTDDRCPALTGDDGKVRQVMMNLILNAIDAAGTGGVVEVATAVVRDGDRTRPVLRVGDSGPGIPVADRSQIFDPFFTTKAHGSGLGLYIVRQIVSEHGGTILAGDRPGGGALFQVVFPPADEAMGRHV